MQRKSRNQFFRSSSRNNLKSKIENPKWLGLSVIAFVLVVCGAVAQAQQPAKIPRIGFLGNSTPALEENLVGPFREGLRELGYIEGKTSSLSGDGPRESMSAFPPLSPS